MEKAGTRDRMVKRILAVLGLIAVVLMLYVIWARPLQLRWGATDEEVQRSMPGDELEPHPTLAATRAITIDGKPEEIWPWLLQMGYKRAGFYGYDIVENGGTASAEHILPQFQNFKVGDEVPISFASTLLFQSIRPDEYIVWTGSDGRGSFTWALYPVDASHTRLVSRIRWAYHWTQPGLLPLELFTDFADHLAVRKILQGVKGRVEGDIEPALDTNIEFFLYVGAAVAFFWTVISMLRLPLSWGSWLVGLGGGVSWLITWYAPVSIWLGALLCFLIVWAVRVEFRELKKQKAGAESRGRGAGQRRLP